MTRQKYVIIIKLSYYRYTNGIKTSSLKRKVYIVWWLHPLKKVLNVDFMIIIYIIEELAKYGWTQKAVEITIDLNPSIKVEMRPTWKSSYNANTKSNIYTIYIRLELYGDPSTNSPLWRIMAKANCHTLGETKYLRVALSTNAVSIKWPTASWRAVLPINLDVYIGENPPQGLFIRKGTLKL